MAGVIMELDWENRPTKDSVRHDIFIRVPKRIKSYVGFPGLDDKSGKAGICIRKGIECGVITKKTKVIGYEFLPARAKHIRASIKRDFPDYDITIYDHDIADAYIKPNTISFAFLDFMGMLDHKMAAWIQNILLPSMCRGGSIAITASFGRQESTFYKTTLKRLNTDLSIYRKAIQDQYKLWDMPSCSAGLEDRKARAMTVQLFLMKYLMRNYHNRSVYRRFYQDKGIRGGTKHVPMMSLLFTEIRPLKDKEPHSIPDLNLI